MAQHTPPIGRLAPLVAEKLVSCRPAVDILGQTVLSGPWRHLLYAVSEVFPGRRYQEEHMGVPEHASTDALAPGGLTPGIRHSSSPYVDPAVRHVDLMRLVRPGERTAPGRPGPG